MVGATQKLSPSLLPLDQQLVALDLPGRRLLARIIACDELGRVTFVVFDPEPVLREKFDRTETFMVEYVKTGLCRASFQPLRIDDTVQSRSPIMVVHGRLLTIETVQRRDNFRVRITMPVEVLLLDGSPDRPSKKVQAEPEWWNARSINVSAEGLCLEIRHDLFRGDVVSLRIHAEERALEADARVIGPRPVGETTSAHHYGVQLIQIPRADQQLLQSLIRKEEQKGLAYRHGSWRR